MKMKVNTNIGNATSFLLILILIGISIVSAISIPTQPKPVNNNNNNQQQQISTTSIQNTINELYKEIQKYQNKNDKSFIPLIQWAELKGLFQSDVRVNFVGNELKTEARRKFAIPDSNMFVTNFVVYTLLESHKLGSIDLDSTVLEDAIDAILTFKDKNRENYETDTVYTFWPQIYNSTMNVYSQYPMNLNHLIAQYGSFQKFVDFFAEEFKLLNVLNDMEMIAEALDTVLMAFHIPSDADDSGCNLGLGQVLVNLPDSQFASTIANWKQSNSNITSLFDTYTKYAYRPFSSVLDENSIDPRSYYVLQGFLTAWKESGRDLNSLLLPTTWFESMSEQKNTFPDLQMPFNVNNVDFSVATNTLFGISSAIYQLQKDSGASENDINLIFNQDLQNLCLSTAYLIENVVASQIVYNRSDLALLYYPSIYDFTWFVSRTVFFLEEFQLAASNSNGEIVFPETLSQVLSILSQVVESQMTNQLIERMNVDAKSGGIYWDDFLGDGDTLFGKPEKYGEDRFFSTSLSVNALIDTWTLPSSSSSTARVWKSNTPDMVQTVVKSAILYINTFILDHPEQTFNAFFSGSVKGTDTLDFFYPANLCIFFNGTICNPHVDYENQFELANAVSGYIDSITYAEMVQQSWGNMPTPTIFHGYNNASFPYWSSKPLTYSISILALSKYTILN